MSDLAWLSKENVRPIHSNGARILEIISCKSGQVSSTRLNLANSEMTKPCVKLAPVVNECNQKENMASDLRASGPRV